MSRIRNVVDRTAYIIEILKTSTEIQKPSRDSKLNDQIKRLQDAPEPRFWSCGPSAETVKLYVPNIVVNVLHTDR